VAKVLDDLARVAVEPVEGLRDGLAAGVAVDCRVEVGQRLGMAGTGK
jgi:hypothetical protein